MKHCIAYISIFAIVLQMFLKPLLLHDYKLHKTFIANNFCVNKSKPKLKCEGKCHLKKQMAKHENQNKEKSQGYVLDYVHPNSLNLIFLQECTAFTVKEILNMFFYLKTYPQPFEEILQPPQV
ncbi:MAG: hypothetical protein U0V72_13205 [Cytophagales bacterium]